MFKKRQYFREITYKLLESPSTKLTNQENYELFLAITEALGSAYIQGINDQAKKEVMDEL